jgi:hypothetical protein
MPVRGWLVSESGWLPGFPRAAALLAGLSADRACQRAALGYPITLGDLAAGEGLSAAGRNARWLQLSTETSEEARHCRERA